MFFSRAQETNSENIICPPPFVSIFENSDSKSGLDSVH